MSTEPQVAKVGRNFKTLIYTGVLVAFLGTAIVAYWVWYWYGPAEFTFDDGTVQHWTVEGIFDDAGNLYDKPGYPTALLAHFPSNAKVGSLSGPNAHLAATLKDPQVNFPKTSAFWEARFVSPSLGPAFDGLAGFQAEIYDELSIDGCNQDYSPVITAELRLRQKSGTGYTYLPAVGIATFDLVHKSWVTCAAKFQAPSKAAGLQLEIRLRGKWAVCPLFEGAVQVDNVKKL